MFTFGIVMCFISAAIYGIVVFAQIKRIDRLDSEMIITIDRLNCYRHRIENLELKQEGIRMRLDEIERHPFFSPLQMTAVSDFKPDDVHEFTVDAFANANEAVTEFA